MEQILKAQGVNVPVEEIFGIRHPKTSQWVIKPKVRYYSESIAERFFDAVAKLERFLPDKIKIGDDFFYVYNHTRDNISTFKGNYDKSYYQKTGKIRVEAENSLPQALIIVDSYPAMNTEGQDEDETQKALALQARMFSTQIPRIKGRMKSKRVTIVGMNQLRIAPMVKYGCFHYQQRVMLADGSWDYIGRIVTQKRKVNVLSFNETTQKFESKRVVGWYNNGDAEQGDFLKIRVQTGLKSGYNDIVCTENHLLMDAESNQMRSASKFVVGDCLVTNTEIAIISADLEQLIYGSFLGDVAFGNKRHVPSMSITHCYDQEDYLFWKRDILKNLSPKIEECKIYQALHVRLPIKGMHQMISQYKPEKRCRVFNGLPEEVFQNLDIKGLAVWYQDEGTFYDASTKVGAKRRYWDLRISASRLDMVQKERLASLVKDLTGANLSANSSGLKSNTKEEIRKFHDALAPYVHPSMEYKLYIGCSSKKHTWDGMVTYEVGPYPAKIISISEYKLPKGVSRGKFDLEVEGNHTYIVGNCVVHNSPNYEPCGGALKFASDCRVQVSARSNPHGKGAIHEEESYDGSGTDKYKYIHAKATKNKLATPYLEGMMRVWTEDSKGKARGFDLVWDCLVGDTLIPTNKGLLRIDEIYRHGILDADGTYAIDNLLTESNTGEYNVLRWGMKGVKKIYELTTSKGYAVRASSGHRFQVLNNRGFAWKCVEDITAADCLLLSRNFTKDVKVRKIQFEFAGKSNSPIFVAADIKIPKTLNADLAEFMGLILSDGTSAKKGPIFYTSDLILLDYVRDLGFKLFGIEPYIQKYKSPTSGTPAYSMGFHSVALVRFFEYLDMASVKCYNLHIPDPILKSSVAIQAAFIKGLMAGDGSYSKTRCTVTYSSSSEKLLKQLQVMLLGMGIISNRSLSEGQSSCKNLNIDGTNAKKFVAIIDTPINKEYFDYELKHDGQSGLRLPILMEGQNATVGAVLNGRHRGTRYEKLLDKVVEFVHSNDLIVDKIHSVKYVGREQTYDIEIEDSHNFVANGFIAHNCYEYLRMTGQIEGKRNKFKVGLNEWAGMKALTWNDFKTLILGTKKEQGAIYEKVGAKPVSLRKYCQNQLAEGNGIDLFFENMHKNGAKLEESSSE